MLRSLYDAYKNRPVTELQDTGQVQRTRRLPATAYNLLRSLHDAYKNRPVTELQDTGQVQRTRRLPATAYNLLRSLHDAYKNRPVTELQDTGQVQRTRRLPATAYNLLRSLHDAYKNRPVTELQDTATTRDCSTHPLLLDEVDVGRALQLDGLTLAVEEGEDEVEEVALPQVCRRLLLVVGPAQADARDKEETG